MIAVFLTPGAALTYEISCLGFPSCSYATVRRRDSEMIEIWACLWIYACNHGFGAIEAALGCEVSGRDHDWHMDALLERTEFVGTLSWLPHGCSLGPDGICLDVIMSGTWMLCGTRRSLREHCHGWHTDALREPTEFVGTSSCLAHGCCAKTDGLFVGRYHGCHMDALPKWTESFCTLSRLPHRCSVGPDGVCLDVIMVGTWMLCGTRRSLRERYALWDPTEFVGTLSWLAHGCSVGTDGVCRNVCHGWHMDALWETDGLFVDVSRLE